MPTSILENCIIKLVLLFGMTAGLLFGRLIVSQKFKKNKQYLFCETKEGLYNYLTLYFNV